MPFDSTSTHYSGDSQERETNPTADLTPVQVVARLDISDGAVTKLRKLRVLLPGAEDQPGSSRTFAAHVVDILAIARKRTLPIDRPTLIAPVGPREDGSKPSLSIDRNLDWQQDDAAEALTQIREQLPEYYDDVKRGKLGLVGHWQLESSNREALVNGGIILGSYAGFILDGWEVVAAVPSARGNNDGHAFIVRPLTPQQEARYLHTYRPFPSGPFFDFHKGEEN